MCKNSVHPFKILSHTITSRENVYHIFHFLGEPKTLNLAHYQLQPVVQYNWQ